MWNKNEIRHWVIYKITSPSGRVYVGKSVNVKHRISNYRTGNCKSQPLLYNSLIKYGFGSHLFEIIDNFIGNNNYANGKEIFWIRSFMSNSTKWKKIYKYDNGLNLTDGSEGMTGYIFSKESKDKMSKAGKGKPKHKLRGRPWSDETKQKMSEMAKNRPSPSLGKKLPEERKKQIGLSKIGNTYMLGKNHTKECREKMSITRSGMTGKPISMFDLNGVFIKEFISKRVAHRETGVARNVINSIIAGMRDSRHKYIFKYKE